MTQTLAGTTADTPVRSVPRRSERWELFIALAVGVVAISGAVLTYGALALASRAADHNEQALAEALHVQRDDSMAFMDALAANGYASIFRDLMAEAEAVRATDPERALVLETVAYTYAYQANVYAHLQASPDGRYDEYSSFDFEGQLEESRTWYQIGAIDPDQPELTANLAGREHAASHSVWRSVVALLAVVVVLTAARLLRRRAARAILIGVATAGWTAALGFGLLQWITA